MFPRVAIRKVKGTDLRKEKSKKSRSDLSNVIGRGYVALFHDYDIPTFQVSWKDLILRQRNFDKGLQLCMSEVLARLPTGKDL